MLHVWLRSQHSPLAVWHADTQQWQTVNGWQQLYDTYNSRKNNRNSLCLYFPSTHILQVDTELNASQLKQLGAMGKQYLFEETALTPVEQLTIRQINNANVHHLYALAQNDIDMWQQSAALAGLNISALLPDFLLLAIPEEGAGQQIVLYQDDYTALLRQSKFQGLAVSYLPLILERMPHLSEVCVIPAVKTSGDISVSVPVNDFVHNISDPLSLQKAQAQEPPILDIDSSTNIAAETVTLMAEKQLLLTVLPTTPTPIDNPERHALNLFTKSSDSQLSPYLRVAMMVALSALVLQMATDGLQVYLYNAAATETQTAVAAQYQSWFPDERLNSRNKLQTQMQPKLRSDSRESASQLAILARISPLIKQSSLQAQSLVIQPTALSFTLIAPDRNSLDEFASTLNSQGLSANLERVNSNEQGQFSGQITVNIADEESSNTSPVES